MPGGWLGGHARLRTGRGSRRGYGTARPTRGRTPWDGRCDSRRAGAARAAGCADRRSPAGRGRRSACGADVRPARRAAPVGRARRMGGSGAARAAVPPVPPVVRVVLPPARCVRASRREPPDPAASRAGCALGLAGRGVPATHIDAAGLDPRCRRCRRRRRKPAALGRPGRRQLCATHLCDHIGRQHRRALLALGTLDLRASLADRGDSPIEGASPTSGSPTGSPCALSRFPLGAVLGQIAGHEIRIHRKTTYDYSSWKTSVHRSLRAGHYRLTTPK